jgi:hypothetical protein
VKTVGVREFNDQIPDYVPGGEIITVERDGEPIGYYLPLPPRRSPEELQQAIERLERVVQRALEESGMTEDELADLFDVSKPFPYDSD